MSVRFLESELAEQPAAACRFQVLPVPYEATVSYGGGTAKGPEAILQASSQLEVWTGRSVPSKQGIFTWPAVDCQGDAETVLGCIEVATEAALAAGPRGPLPKAAAALLPTFTPPPCLGAAVLPVILGGEHSVTLGVLRALQKRYGHFGVIQFDAHADLRDTYEGTPYSHACVMRRAVDDLGLELFQIGVRSLSPEEVAFRSERRIPRLDARLVRFPRPWPDLGGINDRRHEQGESASGNGCPGRTGRPLPPLLPAGFPGKVFLTFDVDAFDASLMPATGTPEPGGLFWWDALHLMERALSGRVCLGFDVTELAPIPGLHAPTYTAARLVHEIMGLFAPYAP